MGAGDRLYGRLRARFADCVVGGTLFAPADCLMQTHVIGTEDDGIRLDRWFKRHYPGLPHAMLEKHLRKGQVRVDGKKAKASDRIEEGQNIEIRLEQAQ